MHEILLDKVASTVLCSACLAAMSTSPLRQFLYLLFLYLLEAPGKMAMESEKTEMNKTSLMT